MQEYDVEFESIDLSNPQELSDITYRTCTFCDKVVRGNQLDFKSYLKLCENFHCPFCLRNKFHLPSSQNILILSYRSIIGYYYHEHYLHGTKSLYQLEQQIEAHVNIGLKSPVFTFDPTNYLWFIDFNHIGKSEHEIPITDILRVIKNMMNSFDIQNSISDKAANAVLRKYKSAINQFNIARYRPIGKRMLIPSLVGCVSTKDNNFWEMTRNFKKSQMIPR